MIISQLKIENIRSYITQVIDFPKGSVLLSGDIGSGKSTILLAIEFALFGIIRTELTGSSLLRHGKNEGSVELKFEIDTNEYIIKRCLKKVKGTIVQDTGYLITNGKKFEGTPVELKSKIIGILGYPEDLVTKSKSLIYRYTVYTPQEEMKQIISEDKELRLDTLRKLFGIDKYKAVRENSTIFVRELRRKQSELAIRLENYSELETEIKAKSERIVVASEEGKKLRAELDKINEIIQSMKLLLEDTEAKIKKVNDAKKNFHVIEAKISGKLSNKENNIARIGELKEHLSKIEEKLSLFSGVIEIVPENALEEELAKIISASEKIDSFEEQLKEYGTFETGPAAKKIGELKKRIFELEELIAQKKTVEKLLEEHKEKDKKASIAIENSNIRIQEAEDKINNILSLKICPTCNQAVEDGHKEELIGKENEKIKSCKGDKAKYTDLIKKIEDNIVKIRQKLANISENEKLVKENKEECFKLEEKLKQDEKKQKDHLALFQKKKTIEDLLVSMSIDKKSLALEIGARKKLLSGARENNLRFREKKTLIERKDQYMVQVESYKKECDIIDKEINELSVEKNNLENGIKGFKDIIEKYEEQKSAFEKEKEKQKNCEIRIASMIQEISFLDKAIKDIEMKLSQSEKTKEKIKELSEIEVWFDKFFMNLMSTMEKHIMISIHKEFETLLKAWFSTLIEDIDISLDEDFSARIIQDGYETDVESLSGGEKTSVALAYRLSLNKVINDLISNIKTKGLIILDEPTDGFSSEQLDKVRDILNDLAMRQTIIVSHEAKMESYVDNIIKVSKEDNISVIEKT